MSALIKTLKAKDETNIPQNIFPKTVVQAVVDPETNKTLDVILDELDQKVGPGGPAVQITLSVMGPAVLSANSITNIVMPAYAPSSEEYTSIYGFFEKFESISDESAVVYPVAPCGVVADGAFTVSFKNESNTDVYVSVMCAVLNVRN